MKKLFLAGSALCFGIAFGEGVTATWKNFTPNTPDTAYDWSDESNWEGGVVAGRPLAPNFTAWTGSASRATLAKGSGTGWMTSGRFRNFQKGQDK